MNTFPTWVMQTEPDMKDRLDKRSVGALNTLLTKCTNTLTNNPASSEFRDWLQELEPAIKLELLKRALLRKE